MKIDITHEEREELRNILELLESSDYKNIELGISLLKNYDKFKNTIFSYDFESVKINYTVTNRNYIKREVGDDMNYSDNVVWLFRFNMIFAEPGLSNFDIACIKFYIMAVLEEHNSFYIG